MSDVFIIGAGCSVPYGFPTGAMLMQKLKEFNYGNKDLDSRSFSPPSYLFDLYQELFGKYKDYTKLRDVGGFSYAGHIIDSTSSKIRETIVPFAKSIRNSMMVSTDEFLKNRLNQEKSEEADFGKRLIAREILVAEQKSKIQSFYENGERKLKKYWLGNIDWIQHFLSRIDQQQDKWKEILKQTVFLTFNYDRVLEYCIFLYLTSDKQYADADAYSFIDEMQIHHINGYIGSLKKIPFGAVENGMYLEIAKGMETVWEKRLNRDASEEETYKGFLKNAQRVYFLGFSYIPDNLDSIGISRGAKIIRKAKVYATAMGLSSQNRLRISSYLDLKDFEKRNEPDPMPEIEIQRSPLMTEDIYQQEYKKKEKSLIKQAKIRRTRYENRILKDASAVDLILDYYTFS